VKLPICLEMITDMRERLVVNRTWSEEAMGSIMLYTGCMFGFEFAARVSEYTKGEKKATDRCVKTDDVTFAEAPTGYFSIAGSAPGGFDPGSSQGGLSRVRGVTTKGRSQDSLGEMFP
jgi:hypothetical protein